MCSPSIRTGTPRRDASRATNGATSRAHSSGAIAESTFPRYWAGSSFTPGSNTYTRPAAAPDMKNLPP